MDVELWVLKKWTQIHPSTRPTQVEAEMDSLGVMNLVKENLDPQGNLIEECKSMSERSNCSINHAFREKNRVADMLANLGVGQEDPLLMLQ
ncbi:hypothetical protein RHMOL_Rhmol05G0171200 [Rhododendron molle]|uniref:Uncharacterized protein n=1 Tax=Rhododendron molle TaxID=49168 RepID=A0ACC0NPS9_RHOML|nr:hypothetical protein RHMOL_Rhmol05G0171200 [Rhododendron molle]